MLTRRIRTNAFCLIIAQVLLLPGMAVAGDSEPVSDNLLFATVGDVGITEQSLNDAVNRRIGTTLYHGTPPAEQLILVRKEVAAELIDRTLLEMEATKRGLEPDQEKIEKSLERMTEHMQKRGRKVSQLDKQQAEAFLRQENLNRQLKDELHHVPDPDIAQVEAFYRENPEKFTEPAQSRLSVILLKVDPSATKDVWAAARREAGEIYQQLQEGAEFGEQARLRSADSSAEQGGDMGYLHSGMLAQPVETVIDQLEIGQVSEPAQVLEGIVLFKLTGRKPAALKTFEEVSQRATELFRKQQGEKMWAELLIRLRRENPVIYHQGSFS